MFYIMVITFILEVNHMSRLIDEHIEIQKEQSSMITAFTWENRFYKVIGILNWWREPAEWWNGELTRLFLRVNARNHSMGTYELYRLGEAWFIHKVLD